MNKRFWIITIILVAGLACLIWIKGNKSSVESQAAFGGATTEHIIGRKDSVVSVVEYSDFQCPACRAYYPTVRQVIEKYGDRISFEYRHYPLVSLHRNAFAAARASEAAGNQGKFWEMYQILFEDQSAWSEADNAPAIFEAYAKKLNLDLPMYTTAFASSKTSAAIYADMKEFDALGLPKSTPTFLINGRRVEARNNVDDFSRLIDEELIAAGR
ncbi:MAG TPA: thioredoxin domain-containing protein [Candidatus Saccharimonadales bacterium]|nr:thioredoxin domain-containing protein [Candidatus Saccharimonadales bacterium]